MSSSFGSPRKTTRSNTTHTTENERHRIPDRWPFSYTHRSTSSTLIKNYYATRSFKHTVQPCWPAAKDAGMIWGEASVWNIEEFETYEQAFAFMHGYQCSNMEKLLPAVFQAIKDFQQGSYSFPTEYHIIDNIPPIPGHAPIPARLEDDSGWCELRALKGIGGRPLYLPSIRCSYLGAAFYPTRLPPLAVIREFCELAGFPPTFPQGSDNPTPGASNSRARNANVANAVDNSNNTGYPTARRFQSQRFQVTHHMRQYLVLHLGFSLDQVGAVRDVISRVPFRSAGMIQLFSPELERLGMSVEAAEFFLGWVFDICEEDDI